MNDDYLWDGSGEADPEIEKLEGLLGRYRSEMPAPALPETQVVPIRSRRSGMLLPIAAAAAIAVLSLGSVFGGSVTRVRLLRPSRPQRAVAPTWLRRRRAQVRSSWRR